MIENFRPGALESWGLGWDALSSDNPKLVLVRISGYGQTGPYRDRPGFGAIAEAMGGMRYITGDPDRRRCASASARRHARRAARRDRRADGAARA